jgi:ABC-type dipeptide/oligopeptide/nickel transport system permease component
MSQYVLGRILAMVPVALGVLVVVFVLLRVLPGDPVEIFLQGSGRGSANGLATPERIAQARAAYNLDKPVPVQFVLYAADVLHGNLGRSFRTGQAVGDIIKEQFPSTVQLTVASLGLAILLGISIGVLSATHPGTVVDYTAQALAICGVAIPTFLVGLMLIFLFSIRLGWLPAISDITPKGLVLPAVALGLYAAGFIARLTRSSLLEVMNAGYVHTARAKGLTETAVVWRHALRNALIPVVTLVGLQFGALLTGAVVVEVVFGRQGLGFTLVTAIQVRDYPVIQALVMLSAVTYAVVNLLVDVVYACINPRVRLG